MRVRILALALAASVAAGAGATAVAAEPAPDPYGEAKTQAEQARAAANEVARQYSDALSEQARVEAKITELERDVPLMRFKAAILREQVSQRAARLYRRGGSAMLGVLLGAEDVAGASRAVELASRAAGHDNGISQELTDTADALQRREAELRDRRAAEAEIVKRLGSLQDLIQERLAVAEVAVKKIEAVRASQAEFRDRTGSYSGLVNTGAGLCPVTGVVAFTDDWHEPRPGGRLHEGTDIMAPTGRPLVAVVAGSITQESSELGGNGVWLAGDDGVAYYYAHLSAYRGGPRRVERGDVIGYVGMTGDATGPHLHWQIHPGGGEPVNPYPTVRALCS